MSNKFSPKFSCSGFSPPEGYARLFREDEDTRECLALEAVRSIKSSDVIEVVNRIDAVRGYLSHVRSDKCPEFVAKALQE
ncbi:MAG: hypothetical protein Pars93KO_25140 [Parasphingorhabdus sp.]